MTPTLSSARRGALCIALLWWLVPACADDVAPGPAEVEARLSDEDRQRLARAEDLMRTQLHEQVRPLLQPLLERQPVPVDAQYLAGQAAYYMGEYGEAATRLADVLARHRDVYLTRSNALGFAHYKLGDFAASRDVFSAITTADPSAHKAHYGLAQVALTEGLYEEARSHVETALSLAPDYLKARFALARVLDGLGEFEAALQVAESLGQAWPSNEELLYLQSQLLHRLDRPEDARAVELRRAMVYDIKQRVGDALGRIRAGEDSPLLRITIIDGFLQLGDLREAIGHLNTARTRWPDDPVLAQTAERLQAQLSAGAGAGAESTSDA